MLTEEEFEKILPDYLKESANDIHARMLSNAPEGISTMEGDFVWNNSRPVALELERFRKISLRATLKLGTTQVTEGKWLDLKGEADGVPRKPGSAAIQKIEIKATPGTLISAGRVVSTLGTDETEPIEYIIQDTINIDARGIGYVNAECTQVGVIGNVIPGLIKTFTIPLDGVTSVKNIEIIKDGVDVESDKSYAQRIIDNAANPPTSGNIAHYEKWCKEYPGIEDCKVISCWNGNNTVKTILVAEGHKAVKEELIDEVHKYIDPYPGEGKAQAPIGAVLTVVSCKEKPINIITRVELMEGYEVEDCKKEFENALTEYLKSRPFKTTNHISIAIIGYLILQTPGVIEYTELYLNGDVKNCVLNKDEIATVGTVEMEL